MKLSMCVSMSVCMSVCILSTFMFSISLCVRAWLKLLDTGCQQKSEAGPSCLRLTCSQRFMQYLDLDLLSVGLQEGLGSSRGPDVAASSTGPSCIGSGLSRQQQAQLAVNLIKRRQQVGPQHRGWQATVPWYCDKCKSSTSSCKVKSIYHVLLPCASNSSNCFWYTKHCTRHSTPSYGGVISRTVACSHGCILSIAAPAFLLDVTLEAVAFSGSLPALLGLPGRML